ncbi:MAG: type IV pilus assembly protein PilM [Candidatus Pacebacteria bacterium]|nr:type IV pilus assembly protein PilM [Candidatus Paceibacterota bacterium]
MPFNPFRKIGLKLFSKNFLGIDIGSSSIKVVELSPKNGAKLENYAQLKTEYFAGKEFIQHFQTGALLSGPRVVEALSAMFEEAKIKTKNAFFSIPDYASFFTTFTLPSMSKKEVEEAIKYEAPRHIPLPLADVTLDWQIIKGTPQFEGTVPLKILLVAVPNETIEQYQDIAKSLNLKILALEAEVFALARALVKYQDKKGVVCLIDVGYKTTTINIVSHNILKTSHSIDLSSEELTNAIAGSLKIDQKRAEIIKNLYGVKKAPVIKEILMPYLKNLSKETKKIFNDYFLDEKERVDKIILSGGGARMPGISEYFNEEFKIPVEVGNPFLDINYLSGLELILQKIGPEFTIALGAALRGIY